MSVLPLLDVNWELVSDNDFRELLAALNFEASYDPRERELTIRATLVPELASPDGLRAPLLVRGQRNGSGAPEVLTRRIAFRHQGQRRAPLQQHVASRLCLQSLRMFRWATACHRDLREIHLL